MQRGVRVWVARTRNPYVGTTELTAVGKYAESLLLHNGLHIDVIKEFFTNKSLAAIMLFIEHQHLVYSAKTQVYHREAVCALQRTKYTKNKGRMYFAGIVQCMKYFKKW